MLLSNVKLNPVIESSVGSTYQGEKSSAILQSVCGQKFDLRTSQDVSLQFRVLPLQLEQSMSSLPTVLLLQLQDLGTWTASIILRYLFDEHHLIMGMSRLTSEFYPSPEMPSTFLKIEAVPSNAAFCKHGATTGMPFRCRYFPALWKLFPVRLLRSVH